ncbi:hypothetical protein [Prevotella sp. 10(H)]|uniref:hypothetical protein n=1 Tax=Prevotella sp. 10(H) TaxID=1158294 RepID=UPI0004A7567D|nr:hypothetical protein [Prevotella sp. 10(H)]
MKAYKHTSLKLLIILVVLALAGYGNAQVTIGSNIRPNGGALLDLKENDNEEENSTKGLLFPRVELEDINSLVPCIKTVPSDPKIYKGLIVYNVEPSFDNNRGKGVYIWDGGKWVYTPCNLKRKEISQ